MLQGRMCWTGRFSPQRRIHSLLSIINIMNCSPSRKTILGSTKLYQQSTCYPSVPSTSQTSILVILKISSSSRIGMVEMSERFSYIHCPLLNLADSKAITTFLRLLRVFAGPLKDQTCEAISP